ncbi:MAG TPA: glycosyltransferase [Gemmatimonadaceae bacterium]|nr:glycosyltransferase [Gemmatimonadaceae bacterium]
MFFRIVAVVDGLLLLIVSLFSVNRYVLVSLFKKHRRRGLDAVAPVADADLPRVTVQLPLYNELYVAERLIDSACALDYPAHLLEIQVLDDSTDETLDLTRRAVAAWRERGVNIVHLHRADRTGYKAGALAYGCARAHGEFLAVFDADFVIPADFLRRTIPHFADAKVGVVQTRWTHLNENYSLLTKATAFGLDGQFVVEQPARSWGGLFLTFNGTAGVLRAECVRAAGGWHHDTLTEDLDLSYRAQILGWRIKYVGDITCDSEIPADIHGLKAQQYRWTKGTQETARKILPLLWASDVSLWHKVQGTIHLLGNSVYPFMLAIGLVNPLLVVAAATANVRLLWPLSLYFLFSLYGTFAYYMMAQRAVHTDWKRRLLSFPLFMAASIGLSVNNAQAAVLGLRRKASPFVRTPKYALSKKGQNWSAKRYRSKMSWTVVLELLLGVYTFAVLGYALVTHEWGAVPFLALFGTGYLMIGGCSVQHVWATRVVRAERGGRGDGSSRPTSRPHWRMPRRGALPLGGTVVVGAPRPVSAPVAASAVARLRDTGRRIFVPLALGAGSAAALSCGAGQERLARELYEAQRAATPVVAPAVAAGSVTHASAPRERVLPANALRASALLASARPTAREAAPARQ